tara:strand:- start:4446 stop:4604 length:159 start_codon:yes stop_codon:yes gene_type:complete
MLKYYTGVSMVIILVILGIFFKKTNNNNNKKQKNQENDIYNSWGQYVILDEY